MITHILNDGRKLNTVKGLIIKRDQNPQIYEFIENVRKRGEEDGTVRSSERSSESH